VLEWSSPERHSVLWIWIIRVHWFSSTTFAVSEGVLRLWICKSSHDRNIVTNSSNREKTRKNVLHSALSIRLSEVYYVSTRELSECRIRLQSSSAEKKEVSSQRSEKRTSQTLIRHHSSPRFHVSYPRTPKAPNQKAKLTLKSVSRNIWHRSHIKLQVGKIHLWFILALLFNTVSIVRAPNPRENMVPIKLRRW
jgi:hypothetical protein